MRNNITNNQSCINCINSNKKPQLQTKEKINFDDDNHGEHKFWRPFYKEDQL